jgi:hypothetical protein
MSSKPRRNPLEPVEEAQELLHRRASGYTPKKGRNRDWDAKRTKATYDLPAGLLERIREIAGEIGQANGAERANMNDVARLLLEAGIEQYEAGVLDQKVQGKAKRVILF